MRYSLGLLSVLFLAGCSSRSEAGCYLGEVCRDASAEPVRIDGGEALAPDPEPIDAGPPDASAPLVDAGPDIESGETYYYVIDALDLGALTSGLLPGFDVDGRVSDADDPQGCYRQDYTSPPPDSLVGVDNILGPALADQEATLGVRRGMADRVADGSLLVLVGVARVDSFLDDDYIEVETLFGVLPAGVMAPALEPDGEYVPGQTFDIDRRSLLDDMTAAVSLVGQIVDGRVQAGPGGFRVRVPWQDTLVAFDVTHSQIRFDITEDGIEIGVLGGALDVVSTLAALDEAMPSGYDPAIGSLLFRGVADLFPNADEECQAASVGLVFSGTTASPGEIVDI